MSEKSLFILTYIFIGILIATLPLFAKKLQTQPPCLSHNSINDKKNKTTTILILTIGIISAFKTWPNLATIITTSAAATIVAWLYDTERLKIWLAFFIAMYLSTSLLWWKETITIAEISTSCLVAIILIKIKSLKIAHATDTMVLLFFYSLVCGYFSYTTSFIASDLSFFSTWHHWGAYIGPAEAMISGALPLRDIPLQYGLGPTLLISQTCGTNC